MGYPMAGHLAAVHDVCVWNRTAQKARAWTRAYAGEARMSIAEAVGDADYVFMCVGEDKDVYDVADQAFPSMKAGAVLVDHTTASSECARICYKKAQKRGIGFVDAPVSGGESGAQTGQLTIMCGGDFTVYQRVLPVMESYARAIRHMGIAGAGQMTKMVNQICIAGVLQGLAEGLHFARQAGLDIGEVTAVIGQGAAQSWQMDNRALSMSEDRYEFGFAVDWMCKDLRIALDMAEKNGARLDITAQVAGFYAEIQKMGGGRWDTSSLLRRLGT